MKANTEDLAAVEASAIALQFSNTLDWHASQQPVEQINSYTDLVAWAVEKSILQPDHGARLVDASRVSARDAGAVLMRARQLREAIYDVFVAVSGGVAAPARALRTINFELSRGMRHLQIAPVVGGYDWRWEQNPDALDAMLWPVARSAAELLTSPYLDRVRQCADDRGCGYLFVDTTRNRSRRWCTMESCGNRAKAKRHYARSRSEAGA